MNVSIVIPAYNAAATITDTLASLQAQTLPNWEAIVVNDGSRDATETIIQQLATQDSRIRLFNQTNQGVSAARNKGISNAKFDWLGFLDADDWFSPQYLEKMTTALAADPSLDAVHCGMKRVDPEGQSWPDRYAPEERDLFPEFACRCPFLIHACIFRKQLAETVGKFDTELQTSEDWDFWQRIARTGARFGAVKEVLAFYRMRPHSLSRGESIFADAIRVLNQGHAPDPRVPNPHPRHAAGQHREKLELSSIRLNLSVWYAGFWLGRGEDGRHLLKLLANDRAPNLSPHRVAYRIFLSITVTTCQLSPDWARLWPNIAGSIQDFLVALEQQSEAVGLARRVTIILERKVVEQSELTEPLTIGKTHAMTLEVTEPLADVVCSLGTERLHCLVKRQGKELSRLELPVWDGQVTSSVIENEIASQFPESILSLNNGEAESAIAYKLPILMYHSVNPTVSQILSQYQVTPDAFEEQLRYLRDAGFYNVSWEAWQTAVTTNNPLPGRAIILTFDDGYLDFYQYAWPLLKKYGFTATVFLVTDCIGGSNLWDRSYGVELSLMGWSEIRQLQAQGVEFGSHSVTHRPLTALSYSEVMEEGMRSKMLLESQLGKAIPTFAYPYGDFDPVIQHLMGACGYTVALSCRPGGNGFQDRLLALRRIEVKGSDSLQEFITKISC